jgi:hypothetical protein
LGVAFKTASNQGPTDLVPFILAEQAAIEHGMKVIQELWFDESESGSRKIALKMGNGYDYRETVREVMPDFLPYIMERVEILRRRLELHSSMKVLNLAEHEFMDSLQTSLGIMLRNYDDDFPTCGSCHPPEVKHQILPLLSEVIQTSLALMGSRLLGSGLDLQRFDELRKRERWASFIGRLKARLCSHCATSCGNWDYERCLIAKEANVMKERYLHATRLTSQP